MNLHPFASRRQTPLCRSQKLIEEFAAQRPKQRRVVRFHVRIDAVSPLVLCRHGFIETVDLRRVRPAAMAGDANVQSVNARRDARTDPTQPVRLHLYIRLTEGTGEILVSSPRDGDDPVVGFPCKLLW